MVSCEFTKAEKFFNYGYIIGTSIRPHIILAACYLRPNKRYIFQVINLTGNLRPILGTQVGYIIIIDIIY